MALPAEKSRNVFCHGQLHLTGQNLGRVFNFRFGHLQAEHFRCYQVKLPNLKSKTWPKQLLRLSPISYRAPQLFTNHCSQSLPDLV